MLFGCASDEQFFDELYDEISERFEKETGVSHEDYLQGVIKNPYRDSKCDYCNCALRDYSLSIKELKDEKCKSKI